MPFPPSMLPGELTSPAMQQRAYAAHENLDSLHTVDDGLRRLVRESWERSLRHLSSPEAARPALSWDEEELEDYRRNHPLAAVMPVIHRLLVRPSHDTGLLIAVGDEHGRLLWVEGDHVLRSRAERIGFVAGADWSETSVGTSAPGTALALGNSVQIAGAEHFNRSVHPWSCTAVPVHDPDSGSVLGVVDITGGSAAVGVHTLSLVEATVAAAQAELRIQRLQQRAAPPPRRPRFSAGPSRKHPLATPEGPSPDAGPGTSPGFAAAHHAGPHPAGPGTAAPQTPAPGTAGPRTDRSSAAPAVPAVPGRFDDDVHGGTAEPGAPAGAGRSTSGTGGHRIPASPDRPAAARNLYRDSLQILGREQGVVHLSGTAVALSERHAELLTLLALHPDGLSAEELAGMVYPEHASITTVRAEMVRLRRLLHKHGDGMVPASRPYRLPRELVVDAQQVLNYLRRGAHRMALNIYRGEVLPRSEAPAIVELRRTVGGLLREAIVTDASPEVLLQYLQLPSARDDGEAWRLALRLLPARSPRRAAVVDHLERLEAQLG